MHKSKKNHYKICNIAYNIKKEYNEDGDDDGKRYFREIKIMEK